MLTSPKVERIECLQVHVFIILTISYHRWKGIWNGPKEGSIDLAGYSKSHSNVFKSRSGSKTLPEKNSDLTIFWLTAAKGLFSTFHPCYIFFILIASYESGFLIGSWSCHHTSK